MGAGAPHQSGRPIRYSTARDPFPRAFHHDAKEGRGHQVREVMRVADGDGASDFGERGHSEGWSRLERHKIECGHRRGLESIVGRRTSRSVDSTHKLAKSETGQARRERNRRRAGRTSPISRPKNTTGTIVTGANLLGIRRYHPAVRPVGRTWLLCAEKSATPG
jgi:hypothetical protein